MNREVIDVMSDWCELIREVITEDFKGNQKQYSITGMIALPN